MGGSHFSYHPQFFYCKTIVYILIKIIVCTLYVYTSFPREFDYGREIYVHQKLSFLKRIKSLGR